MMNWDGHDYHLLVAGGSQSGVSSMVTALSESVPSKLTLRLADSGAPLDRSASVTLEHGVVELGDGERLHLLGVPTEADFSRVSERLAERCVAVCVLVHNGVPRPFDDLHHFFKSLKPQLEKGGVVLGVSHMDSYSTVSLEEYKDYLAKQHWSLPVFEVDARSPKDVALLAQAAMHSAAVSPS